MAKRSQRGTVPPWARSLGLICGFLVIIGANTMREILGLAGLLFFVIVGLVMIVASLLPARR